MANTYTYFERTAGAQHNNAADWTQINKNVAAVISTNGTAAPAEALDQKFSITNVLNVASTATDKVFSANYVTDNFSTGGGGGGGTGSTEPNPQFPAGSFDYPTSNPAPLDTDSGGTGTVKRHLFDDTTNESVIAQFKVPSDIDTSGQVTFKMYGYAVTATTGSRDVVFNAKLSPAGDGEDWDQAFTSASSGAKTTADVQDTIELDTWTATASALSLTASDFCRLQLVRQATDGSDNLPGDYALLYFEIDIPRA